MNRIKKWLTAPLKFIRIPLEEYLELRQLRDGAELFFMVDVGNHHWVPVGATMNNGCWEACSPVTGELRCIIVDLNGNLMKLQPSFSSNGVTDNTVMRLTINVDEG